MARARARIARSPRSARSPKHTCNRSGPQPSSRKHSCPQAVSAARRMAARASSADSSELGR
eukprot:1286789-Pyramimonas_sp.AAC.1